MKYKWLMFDADGTLFDFDRSEYATLETTFKQFGLVFEPPYAQVYREIDDQIWQDIEAGKIQMEGLRTERFKLFFDAISIEAKCDDFSERYMNNLATAIDLIEGAEEILSRLFEETKMILITNGPGDVQRSRVSKSTIGGYFMDVVISDEVGASKPDSRIFDEAFKRMSNPNKDEVLIIGDSLSSDMRGGYEYGIDTCWFNPGRCVNDLDVECNYEIAALSDLLDIVE
ncbi:MAG: YjjG family noncanonical pyrimidine nucleotidase [candidate division Zixibacteria bacterium]